MKRKIINMVELVLHLVTLAVLFFSKYEVAKITGVHNGLPVYSSTEKVQYFWFKELLENPIYCIPLIILWTISIVMCIVSVFSKQNSADGKMHAAMPIINFVITTWCMLSLSASNGYFVVTFLMFLIMIIGFVKRSTLIVPKEEKQQVTNNIRETSNADELIKYKDLLDSGVITQEEFNAKKKELLGL